MLFCAGKPGWEFLKVSNQGARSTLLAAHRVYYQERLRYELWVFQNNSRVAPGQKLQAAGSQPQPRRSVAGDQSASPRPRRTGKGRKDEAKRRRRRQPRKSKGAGEGQASGPKASEAETRAGAEGAKPQPRARAKARARRRDHSPTSLDAEMRSESLGPSHPSGSWQV